MMYKWKASLFTFLLVGALGLVFLITSSVQAAPPAGTISYWKLDEDVAGVPGVADAYEDVIDAPNGNNGEVPAAPKTAPTPNPVGIVGGAQDFDGVANAINVPDPIAGSFDFLITDAFTIECWMKSSTALGAGTENQVLVGRDDTAGSTQWWLGIQGGVGANPGNVSFILLDEDGQVEILRPTAPAPVLINDGVWHHIVGVYDGTGANGIARLYVDGNLVFEKTPTVFTGDFVAVGGPDLNMGWLNPVFQYEGALDEVAIYNRALTPTEIDQHYDNGLAGHGIDYVAPDDDDNGGGGGGGGGCFIGTMAK